MEDGGTCVACSHVDIIYYSSYDRALDEERRGSLPASIGSADAMPLLCQLTSRTETSGARSAGVDRPECPGSSIAAAAMNGACETPVPASPSVSRPVGAYMKKGLKQAVQSIKRASSIGKLDKKKSTLGGTPLPSAGASLSSGSSLPMAPQRSGSSVHPVLLRSASRVETSADSSWSAGTLYSKLKRSMSLSKLTRKRTNPRLDESFGGVSASIGPTSSKLKTALSCESLVTESTAGPEISTADIGEGNAQVQILHPSVLGQDNCFQIVTDAGVCTFYACQSLEERDQWMACIRRAIHPGEEKSHRTHVSLKLWIQEAKNCLPKKKYFCEISLDKTIYARTSVKTKADMLFWGEQFEFDNLPEVATISVALYRDTEKKKRLDRHVCIGQVSIPVSCLANHQIIEKWYSTSTVAASSGRAAAAKPELQPQIRLKARYQRVRVLPLVAYADLLHYVQANYMHMVDNLEPSLSVRAKDDIAGVLVSIMLAEGKARNFLCDIVMADVLKQDNRHLTFRSNTIATKAVEAYMKIVGRKYLRTVLGEFIRSILDSGDDCEVDPAKLHASGSGTLQRQQLSLLKHCEAAWFKISLSISDFPRELQDVFVALRDRSSQLGKADVADNLISSCVFLRFLCPAIMSPSLFGLCQDFPDERSARALTLVAKTIQSLANFSKFGGKEDYMLYMNDFVEREWSHMQIYLQRISTVDARLTLAQAEFPAIDVGKELGMLHELLIDELTGGVPASAAAAAAQQPRTNGAALPPLPLDGLRALLLHISDDLAGQSVLSVPFGTSGSSGSSEGGQSRGPVPALAAARAGSAAAMLMPGGADTLPPASPMSDCIEFAWRQPSKPGSAGSLASAAAAAWPVSTSVSESGAKATSPNETTAKPLEVAEQSVAFTGPASLRSVEMSAAQSETEVIRRRDNSAPQAVGRLSTRQQLALSGDYVDLVTLPNGSSVVLGAPDDDDLLSSASSNSRTATPSSGCTSCSVGATGGGSSIGRDGSLATTGGGLHKAQQLFAGGLPSQPPRKELYGSSEASPAVPRAAGQAVPHIASLATSAAAASVSSSPRQQPSTPLVFINPGYQRRPSAGGPLPSRPTRKPPAASAGGDGPEEQQPSLTSASVAAQASPAAARFQTLPNRYGSQSVRSTKAGPPVKPDTRPSARLGQQQLPPPPSAAAAGESRSSASTRSDQSLAASRACKSVKGVDGPSPQSSSGSSSQLLQSRAEWEQSASCDLLLAARDEKRYGCAAFPVADLDSPVQLQCGARSAAGGAVAGGGSATSSRRSEQRVRAHSASSADGGAGGGGEGSGGETPPSERSWSSSQGSFSSTSARTIQRKLEQQECVKKEHEGMVEALKSQLDEAQRRLEETEEQLAKQAEQTTTVMSEWRQRLDASEAKLHAQQQEKDVQMQAILDRLHCVEADLRREQQEMKDSILKRQRMIELQEQRIEQLDAANTRLVGSLQQLRERVGGGVGERQAATAGAASLVSPAAVVAPAAATGERQQQLQTTYKTILYYSHDAGKTGFV